MGLEDRDWYRDEMKRRANPQQTPRQPQGRYVHPALKHMQNSHIQKSQTQKPRIQKSRMREVRENATRFIFALGISALVCTVVLYFVHLHTF
jgi:hypothetical protein